MRITALLVATALLAGCAAQPRTADPSSDAPEARYTTPEPVVRPATYGDALTAWRRPEDVNAWIGAMFAYDLDRAIALSESQRAAKPAPPILEPAAFFDRPSGVCVDLARFAVETLNRVSPELKARYLMIEFNPATLRGQVLRRHWVAVYESPDGLRVIADSKRPGYLAGPYPTIASFITEYSAFRGRDVVAYRELASYQRKTRAPAQRPKSDA